MSNDGEGEKAIAALNGRELGAGRLNINEARPKEERGGSGYRGNGGGQQQHTDAGKRPRLRLGGASAVPFAPSFQQTEIGEEMRAGQGAGRW
jgi:hypothetical protein